MSDAFTMPRNPLTAEQAGASPKRRWRTWHVLLLAGISFLLGIMVGIYLPAAINTATGTGSEPRPKDNRHVRLDTFRQVKPGMTYEEVQEVFGDVGSPVPSAGQGMSPKGDFTRQWQNGKSAIILKFDHGKMVQKRAENLD